MKLKNKIIITSNKLETIIHAWISFSGYFEGIVGNLELMPTYYPGWIMRLYYDLDDKDPITQVI